VTTSAERERPLQVPEDEREVERGEQVEESVERSVELDPH
jgi:hypothetical protein